MRKFTFFLFNPFSIAVPFWGQTTWIFLVVCPQNGTAVLKGSKGVCHGGGDSVLRPATHVLPSTPCVKVLVRWATGKGYTTNRVLPNLSLTTHTCSQVFYPPLSAHTTNKMHARTYIHRQTDMVIILQVLGVVVVGNPTENENSQTRLIMMIDGFPILKSRAPRIYYILGEKSHY